MAKKCMLERELKRQKLVKKYKKKKEQLFKEFYTTEDFDKKLIVHGKIQKIPRNAAQNRLRNRCWRTDFGLSRNMLREMGHQGLLPGVKKSSW